MIFSRSPDKEETGEHRTKYHLVRRERCLWVEENESKEKQTRKSLDGKETPGR